MLFTEITVRGTTVLFGEITTVPKTVLFKTVK